MRWSKALRIPSQHESGLVAAAFGIQAAGLKRVPDRGNIRNSGSGRRRRKRVDKGLSFAISFARNELSRSGIISKSATR